MSEEEKKKEMTQEETSEEVVEETLEEEMEEEISELEALQIKAGEYEDKYLRAHAEMQNIARRTREERENLQKYRSQDLAKKILPSLDNLERALQAEATDEAGENLKKGIEMVRESLIQALKDEGIEEIEAQGVPFDPNLHQAVQTIPATEEIQADTIAQVLQKGYKLKDRTLRPAMVVVAN